MSRRFACSYITRALKLMENAINKTGAPLTFDFLGKSRTQCHYGGSTRLGGFNFIFNYKGKMSTSMPDLDKS